jgi:Flp pilus assembly pilin Flp
MSRFLHGIRRLLTREAGATAVEYAVLLASIVLVTATAVEVLSDQVTATFTDMATLIGTGS